MAKKNKNAARVVTGTVERLPTPSEVLEQSAQAGLEPQIIDETEEPSALAVTGDYLESLEVELSKAEDLKEGELTQQESDFWHPQEPLKNHPKKMRGLYIGSQIASGRRYQHAMAVLGKDGKPCVKRFNGSMQLTKEILEHGAPKRVMEVEFLEKTTTGSGRKFCNWRVLWGPKP